MNGRTAAGAELDVISRVLKHEARTGFQDASTTQGLSQFIGERAARHQPDISGEQSAILQSLQTLVTGYRELSVAQRQAVIQQCTLVLHGGGPIANPTNAGALAPAQPQPASTSPAAPPRSRRAAVSRVKALSDSVRLLPGVGDGRAKQLELLGVYTVRDLLELYPRRHIDYGKVQPIGSLLFGGICTIQGEVVTVSENRTRTGKTLVDVLVQDLTGMIHATWFNPYIARQLRPGANVSLSGRVEHLRGTLCLSNPEWELLDAELLHTGRLTPVYPLTKNLYQKTMRPIVRHALDAGLPLIDEYLPDDVRTAEHLLPLRQAVEWAHFPAGESSEIAQQRLEAAQARLAFDEFLTLQLGLLRRKQAWAEQPGNALAIDETIVGNFIRALPFALTGAQRRTLREILAGLAAPGPMTRMLQGDVGSGKTVVAASAMVGAINAGYQTALMAPTEILAEQHASGFQRLFAALPEGERPVIGFLSGAVTGTERASVLEGIRDGSVDLLIGTHALIQLGVEFRRLGFVVIDEQHRFGVEQRSALRSKGQNPDVLVMTATPIPRTLALTLHGDLDVSTLDELPPGRQPIETRWLAGRQRSSAYVFMREEVARGRQAFIIVPLVEESEAVDARAAVAEYERLGNEVFPDLRLGLLHGRLRPSEKDQVMHRFRDGEIDVLVATSVVEVGIDVPNATVMLIDGADRFGLAQLHQFRGRVGRGHDKSYCLLLADDVSQEGKRRLQALVDSQDGFYLAQVDLELRGPGDFLGTRQSGLPELHLAHFADVRDLELARRVAEGILEEDPELSSPRFGRLAARVDQFWSSVTSDVS